MEKAIMFWSGGKDSAVALLKILNEGKFSVEALVTTAARETQRVSMHGVRVELIEKQVGSIRNKEGRGIPFDIMWIDAATDNSNYEKGWERILKKYETMGVRTVIYGDIFLEDLKKYREQFLQERGWKAVFPLWKKETKVLAKEIIESGIKTHLCALDPDKINVENLGMEYNLEFLEGLKEGVDLCGENGEFHTFVTDTPYFKEKIPVTTGEIVKKSFLLNKESGTEKSFYFIDLLSVPS